MRISKGAESSVVSADVLVCVHATTVNVLDEGQGRRVRAFPAYCPPFVLGHDVGGTVVKVSRFKVGDEIYARSRDHRVGTFAELISIHEDDVALKPRTLTMEDAGSIPLVALTAWQVLILLQR